MKDKRNIIIAITLLMLFAMIVHKYNLRIWSNTGPKEFFSARVFAYDSGTENDMKGLNLQIFNKKVLLYSGKRTYHQVEKLPVETLLQLKYESNEYEGDIDIFWLDSRISGCMEINSCELTAKEKAILTTCTQNEPKSAFIKCSVKLEDGYIDFNYNYDGDHFVEIENLLICNDCPFIKYIEDIHLDHLTPSFEINLKEQYYNLPYSPKFEVSAILDGNISKNVFVDGPEKIIIFYDQELEEGKHILEILVEAPNGKKHRRKVNVFAEKHENVQNDGEVTDAFFTAEISSFNQKTLSAIMGFTLEVRQKSDKGKILYRNTKRNHLITNLPMDKTLWITYQACGYETRNDVLWIDSRIEKCVGVCEFIGSNGFVTRCSSEDKSGKRYKCDVDTGENSISYEYTYIDNISLIKLDRGIKKDKCSYLKDIPNIHLDPNNYKYSFNISDYYCNKACKKQKIVQLQMGSFSIKDSSTELFKIENDDKITLFYYPLWREGGLNCIIRMSDLDGTQHDKSFIVYYHHEMKEKHISETAFDSESVNSDPLEITVGPPINLRSTHNANIDVVRVEALDSLKGDSVDNLSLRVFESESKKQIYSENNKTIHIIKKLPLNAMLTFEYRSCEYKDDSKTFYFDEKLRKCNQKCEILNENGIITKCTEIIGEDNWYDCSVGFGDEIAHFRFTYNDDLYFLKIQNIMEEDDCPYLLDIPEIYLSPDNDTFTFLVTDYYCNKECPPPAKALGSLGLGKGSTYTVVDKGSQGEFIIKYEKALVEGPFELIIEIEDSENKIHRTSTKVYNHHNR